MGRMYIAGKSGTLFNFWDFLMSCDVLYCADMQLNFDTKHYASGHV
jgi:hypothetical protein